MRLRLVDTYIFTPCLPLHITKTKRRFLTGGSLSCIGHKQRDLARGHSPQLPHASYYPQLPPVKTGAMQEGKDIYVHECMYTVIEIE